MSEIQSSRRKAGALVELQVRIEKKCRLEEDGTLRQIVPLLNGGTFMTFMTFETLMKLRNVMFDILESHAF